MGLFLSLPKLGWLASPQGSAVPCICSSAAAQLPRPCLLPTCWRLCWNLSKLTEGRSPLPWSCLALCSWAEHGLGPVNSLVDVGWMSNASIASVRSSERHLLPPSQRAVSLHMHTDMERLLSDRGRDPDSDHSYTRTVLSLLQLSFVRVKNRQHAEPWLCWPQCVTDSDNCRGRETEKGGLSTDIALSWLFISLNCFLKRYKYIYIHTHIYTCRYVYICI